MKTTLASLLLLTGCATVSGPRPTLGDTKESAPGRIVVDVTGMRNDHGNVNCDLFAGPKGFPVDSSSALIALTPRVSKGRAQCLFEHVPAGVYAVAALHDENDNNDMDTGLFGIPKEGETASRGAKGFMGPPRFDDAAFEFKGGEAHLELVMRY